MPCHDEQKHAYNEGPKWHGCLPLNRPGFGGGLVVWCFVLSQGSLTMLLLFELGRCDAADRLQESVVVEPVDPFKRRELDLVEALPAPTCGSTR